MSVPVASANEGLSSVDCSFPSHSSPPREPGPEYVDSAVAHAAVVAVVSSAAVDFSTAPPGSHDPVHCCSDSCTSCLDSIDCDRVDRLSSAVHDPDSIDGWCAAGSAWVACRARCDKCPLDLHRPARPTSEGY